MRIAPGLGFLALAFAGSIPGFAAHAQTPAAELRVRLEAAPGLPLSGALVALLDSSDRVVAEALSPESGRRLFKVPPGTYRVRVRRIGFRPFVSQAVAIPREGDLLLRVESLPVSLAAVTISVRSRCERMNQDAEGVAAVWEEISKALQASKLTVTDLAGVGRARVYRKRTLIGGAVLSADTATVPVTNQRPFGSPDPATLAARGYVRGDANRGWEYFAPDEAVLLSDEFVATHCFKLVRDAERPEEIGLAFEPTPRRRTSDVAGVLWVNRATSELREMTFKYVNAGLLSRFDAGGFTRFRRMPSGAWIVHEWQLRAPWLEIHPGARDHIVASGYVEDGGLLIASTAIPVWPTGGVATIAGAVYDSLSSRPLGGATVLLGETAATSDDAGRFTFANVAAGVHVVTWSHPVLSALGLVGMEREVQVTGDTVEILLAVPSYRAVWRRICRDSVDAVTEGDRGILHGVVRDESGIPVAGAPVQIRWMETPLQVGLAATNVRLALDVVSDGAGQYTACGFRRAARGAVGLLEGDATSARDFNFSTALVVRRDLSRSASRPEQRDVTRQVIVTVLDSASGMPLADATVFIEGTTETAWTDDAGRAVLHAASRDPTVVVRRIGFAQLTLRLTLGTGLRQQLPVTLSRVQALAAVEVIGHAPLLQSIERRRSLSRGWVYGPEELAATHHVKTLIGRTPGAAMDGTARWRVRFRHPNLGGDCWADVYIDGELEAPHVGSFDGNTFSKFEGLDSYPPSAIYAIEVYPRASQAPQDIVKLRDGCGVILVWTQSYAERELAREERRNRARPESVVP